MDVATHVTIGAFAGIGFGKGKRGSAAIWVAVFLGSMAPDIDALLHLINPDLYSASHRMYTHTLLGVAILSAVTAGLITFLSRQPGFFRLYFYVVLGGLIHLGLDALTNDPLYPLVPFSAENYALGLVGRHDPFFKAVALIGGGLILILPRLVARPLLLLGLVVMVGRAAVAFFFHR